MTAANAKKETKTGKMPKLGQITIRLKKGTVACNPNQRATINGLGLKKREQVKTLENSSSVRGMIKKVLHLVEVVSETRG